MRTRGVIGRSVSPRWCRLHRIRCMGLFKCVPGTMVSGPCVQSFIMEVEFEQSDPTVRLNLTHEPRATGVDGRGPERWPGSARVRSGEVEDLNDGLVMRCKAVIDSGGALNPMAPESAFDRLRQRRASAVTLSLDHPPEGFLNA